MTVLLEPGGDRSAPTPRAGSYGLAAWVLPVAASVVATPWIVRALGPEEYGRFVAASGIVLAFSSINLVRMVTVAMAGSRTRELVRPVLALAVVLGVVGIPIAVGALVLADPSSSSAALAAAVAAGLPVVTLHGAALGLLFGVGRLRAATALIAVTGCATSLGYVVLAEGGAGPAALLWWLAVVLLASAATALVLLRRASLAHPAHRGPGLGAATRAVGRRASPYLLAQAAGGLGVILDRVVLGQMGDLDDLARFGPLATFAALGSAAASALITPMVADLTRWWHRGEVAGIHAWARRLRVGMAAVVGVCALPVVLVGPRVVELLLGDTLAVTHGDVAPFVGWVLVGCLLAPGWAVAEVIGAADLNGWAMVATLVLLLAVGIPAAAAFGAPGIALAHVAGLIVVPLHWSAVVRRSTTTSHEVIAPSS